MGPPRGDDDFQRGPPRGPPRGDDGPIRGPPRGDRFDDRPRRGGDDDFRRPAPRDDGPRRDGPPRRFTNKKPEADGNDGGWRNNNTRASARPEPKEGPRKEAPPAKNDDDEMDDGWTKV